MRLTLQNHIVCADYGQVHLDARVVGQIIDYTAETWQPDRPKKERECNIEQGKIAEEITEQFIRQYYSQELSLKTYDEIRNVILKNMPRLIFCSGKPERSTLLL